MAIIDLVKWEGTPGVFAWRFPRTNLTTATQLVVAESQEAVFFHEGKLLQKFGPGRHTLTTENIPVLHHLFGIPFGGENPFTAEVWFVNKVTVPDIKWGTPQPLQLRDPEYSVMIPVRGYGQFGIRISDSEKFLVKLVGTLPGFTVDKLKEYFQGVLLSKISSAVAQKIAEEKMSVLQIVQHVFPLSESLHASLRADFLEYGIELVNFFIATLAYDDRDESVVRLKELLSKKVEMDLLGYDYRQMRSFDTLEAAAKNPGEMSGFMGLGMGLGMGAGAGQAMGGLMRQVMDGVQPGSAVCPKCGGAVHAGAKFCPLCGCAVASAGEKKTVVCNECGKPIPEGARFCPYCGDDYHACPACKSDIPGGAAVCPVCGEKLPQKCGECGADIPADSKFCPGCGAPQKNICPECGRENDRRHCFCGGCGEKLK